LRKVHHKLMVIDERLTIVGSFNYTDPTATLNDENIIVLGDLEDTTAAAETAQRTMPAMPGPRSTASSTTCANPCEQ
jgi:phosphatidylserine/phosphatidylglycerophosphate/cardiolipin synthase-like enzyme